MGAEPSTAKWSAMNIKPRTFSLDEVGLAAAGGGSWSCNPPGWLSVWGDTGLLRGDMLGLFCSVRCPGDRILRAYDHARKLRDDGVTVIGGFHSPVEKECLHILLRGHQPIVVCPARSLTRMRIGRDWQRAIEGGRLLLASPFAGTHRRATGELAQERNEFVAAIANRVWFIHVTPGGALKLLANRMREAGKPMEDS